MKTLRRRLTRLAAHHCAEQLGAELARLRVDQRGHLMGFLYVDGHVRAYHGQRAIASKAYVARRHLAMPATTDYWINDRSGDPLLVITGEVDAALTKALPRLLREVRDVVGERRVTIVFDRGGWSPKLFATMIKDGFDVLTYRKGRCRRINERRFIRRRAKLDGRWVDYLLHDQPVRFLKGKLRLRQVTRLCDGGHQTNVITSRWDLRDIEVAYRMFERWRQENFFKYMREEFLLDALVDYQIEPEDPTRTIPNPERRALDKQIRAARADLARLEREYGAAAAEQCRAAPADHAGLQDRPWQARQAAAHRPRSREPALRAAPQRSQARRSPRPQRAGRGQARHGTQAPDRHHQDGCLSGRERSALRYCGLTTPVSIKRGEPCCMSCSPPQATSASPIASCISPWLRSARRIERSAAQALCEILDKTATIFPGSRLRIRFAMRPPPRIGLAFPGSPSSAAPSPSRPRLPDRPRNRTFLRYPMSGVLKLVNFETR